ncbi:SDR family NAD(P)-dependent oxidoreductase [Chondromyces crocatus]|uniref:Short-chain dehydrogenase n=1 Tax=Chondromyces crocatus TaxID=52 RepID=A0A0K1EA26_CHOCO|nr:SDR family NAD(P)-dependent oxidoreductase [Chondromyces crocatus]AKT37699.1 short-chain dehydrogenase [Chondromyces crocatus]
MGQLVLVTGASSGIGLVTAVACAAAGHQVIATLRSLERRGIIEEAAKKRGIRLDIEQLDVTAPDIEERIKELILKYGPFSALVNNAGIAVGGVFEEQSEEDVREQFETNVFGLMAVTRAVLPSMRAARRGRIINMSSVSGLVGLPGVSVYAATKHAIEGFSEALRWELQPFGVEVCLLEPGTFRTSIFFENQRRASRPLLDRSYQAMTEAVERFILGEAAKAPPPDRVASAVVELLAAPSPPFRTLVGRDARALLTLRRVVPDRLFALGLWHQLGMREADPDRSR